VIQDGKDRDWVLLRKSDEHELYRTPSGVWIVVPIGEERFSELYIGQLIRALMLDVDSLIKEADRLISKGGKLNLAGITLMAMGVIAMSIVLAGALKAPNIDSTNGQWTIGVIVVGVSLCPIAVLLGRLVIGPRLYRSPPVQDDPFRVVEFKSRVTEST
jgi:hypothetical protein